MRRLCSIQCYPKVQPIPLHDTSLLVMKLKRTYVCLNFFVIYDELPTSTFDNLTTQTTRGLPHLKA